MKKYEQGQEISVVGCYSIELEERVVVAQNGNNLWIEDENGDSYVISTDEVVDPKKIIFCGEFNEHETLITDKLFRVGCTDLNLKEQKQLFGWLAKKLGYELK